MKKNSNYYEALGRYTEHKANAEELLQKRCDIALKLKNSLSAICNNTRFVDFDADICSNDCYKLEQVNTDLRINIEKCNEFSCICDKPVIKFREL